MSDVPHSAPGCQFCLGNDLLHDAPLFSNRSCYFLASADPVLQHAGMVIPFRHAATPFDLDEVEWRDTFDLLEKARGYLSEALPDGYTVGWNVGAAAGQTVGHAHLHIISRFADEPLVGRGLRHHLKQPANRRPIKD